MISHEQQPDGIEVLTEDGGHIVWTQMGKAAENDGYVQSAKLDGTGIKDLFKAGEVMKRRHRQRLVILTSSDSYTKAVHC